MKIDGRPLSEREKEVAKILLQGKSNKQIALELGISNRTVEFHLRNIYTKLGVASRTEAVLRLAESHLWETPGADSSLDQVEATVDGTDDSTENDSQTIFRRISMKQTYFLTGVLLATCLLGGLFIINLPFSRAEPTPAATSGQPTQVPATQPAAQAPSTASTEITPTEAVVIPPHTVNGYTAAIESYYVDTANLIFHVRLTGGELAFGDENYYSRVHVGDLYDKNGNMLNSSGGSGPAAADPELIQLDYRPQAHLIGDRFQGQFTFDVKSAPPQNETLARFRFDVDLPVHSPEIYQPKQAVSANNLEILLDQVTITPDFTNLYLCFPPPSFAPWTIGSQSVLQIDEQETSLHHDKLLFGSDLGGDRRAGSEPYWAPPVKNGRCIKAGFAIGSSNPTSLTLTIPELENSAPDVLLTGQLATDYPGLSPRQAYQTYLDEHGNMYRGPWIFKVDLVP